MEDPVIKDIESDNEEEENYNRFYLAMEQMKNTDENAFKRVLNELK